jgi:ethanolamine utilization protein EutN
MNLAEVIGHATSTVKHQSLHGWRMIVVQPLDARNRADGTPLVAIDSLGCGRGDHVVITSDGKAVSEMVRAEDTPSRWAVIGLADNVSTPSREHEST